MSKPIELKVERFPNVHHNVDSTSEPFTHDQLEDKLEPAIMSMFSDALEESNRDVQIIAIIRDDLNQVSVKSIHFEVEPAPDHVNDLDCKEVFMECSQRVMRFADEESALAISEKIIDSNRAWIDSFFDAGSGLSTVAGNLFDFKL